MKVRRITEGELWRMLVKDGYTPREAKLECRLMYILDTSLKIAGEKVKLLRREKLA